MSALLNQDRTPIVELNTTPLIDVMLVLLVMLIITIPIQTHSIKVDIPLGPSTFQPKPVSNLIEVSAGGATLFNGTEVDHATLRALLRKTQQMQPVPELHLRPDPYARYEAVDGVLATIKREEVSRFGFVGNEAYRLP